MWNKLFHIFIKRQEKEMGSIVRTEKKVEFHETLSEFAWRKISSAMFAL
jgi:hypothetical protein